MNAEQAQSHPVSWVRGLQRKLYLAAKERPERGFGILYDKVCRADVLMEAWKRVSANGGGHGVDEMTIRHIREVYGVDLFLKELQEELEAEKYTPERILRVYIPKDDGGQRPLGIPTVKDRVAQMAVKLIIEPLFEADFLEVSYGYRPGRSNQDAVRKVHQIANWKRWIVDIDLKSYFDTIPHGRLMELVAGKVKDPRILALVVKWLKAGILEDGKVTEPESGTPQGGVLSPLLSNIYLHQFDREWKGWHGSLVRFADDMVILCRTKWEAERALKEAERIIDSLGLRINWEKTKIRCLGEGFDFLGFTFREGLSNGRHRKVVVKYPRKKSLHKIKGKIKERLKRTPLGCCLDEAVRRVNPLIRGWINYFRIGNTYKAALEVSNEACRQLRIFWRRKKQDKRSIGYDKWRNRYFYDRGVIYAPAFI